MDLEPSNTADTADTSIQDDFDKDYQQVCVALQEFEEDLPPQEFFHSEELRENLERLRERLQEYQKLKNKASPTNDDLNQQTKLQRQIEKPLSKALLRTLDRSC